jgi:hypothetical protein
METLIDRAVRTVDSAYGRIRGRHSPPFDRIDGGARCLALAAAMVAEDEPRAALRDIVAMETMGANATVRRMAQRARKALSDSGSRAKP